MLCLHLSSLACIDQSVASASHVCLTSPFSQGSNPAILIYAHYDLKLPTAVLQLPEFSLGFSSLCFSADGERLAVGGDARVSVYAWRKVCL